MCMCIFNIYIVLLVVLIVDKNIKEVYSYRLDTLYSITLYMHMHVRICTFNIHSCTIAHNFGMHILMHVNTHDINDICGDAYNKDRIDLLQLMYRVSVELVTCTCK